MPYKSEAQREWAHTPEGEEALGGPKKVEEWDQASAGLRLPARKEKEQAETRRRFKEYVEKLRAK